MILQRKNERNRNSSLSGYSLVLMLFCSLILCGGIAHVDAANAWINVGLDGINARNLIISPNWTTDHTMFVTDMPTSNPGYIHRTTDGGSTWQSYQPCSTVSYSYDVLGLSPDYQYSGTDQRLFAGGGGTWVFISNNSGSTWDQVTAPLTVHDESVWDYAISPAYPIDGTVFLVGNDGVFKSVDGGLTFSNVTPLIVGESLVL
jgi:hypothetical protein